MMDIERTPIHILFERQAALQPDAIAVTFEEMSLTYGELNVRANQLAWYLRHHGAGPEILIGICIERSLEMPIAVLGVLKSGSGYVPLDPTYPPDRLAFMLQDAQLPLLLTQERLAGRHTSELTQVFLDSSWPTIAEGRTDNPPFSGETNTLAYMIYTSGSTGRPKGTLIEHAGVTNLALAQKALFAIRPGCRILQFASLSFDASVFELCMAFTNGATLCMGEQDALLPGFDLQSFLLQHAVTHVTLPPSALAALPDEYLPSLHTIISAGEAISCALATQYAARYQLYNAYGPTEATVWATGASCEVQDLSVHVSIGTAITHVEIYVLDAFLQPVADGMTGELYLGGRGIARGYLHQPALTAERFVPHPFTSDAGARLYKTGDLVRRLENGSLEYIGRLDHQVKLRGFRIELDEIALVINTYPCVQRSLVLLREDIPGDKRLVAYIAAQADTSLESEALRIYLQQRLPGYMVPSIFISLPEFPLTPNGKIDRQQLLQPKPKDSIERITQDPPRTSTEKTIAALWSQMLDVPYIGIHDSFLALGGHSLRAAQIIARIHDLYHIKIPLRIFFENATVAKLATIVDTATGESEESDSVLIGRRASIELPYLSSSQRRLWFLDQLETARPAYIVSILHTVRGSLHIEALQHSINAIVARHEILRTRFADHNGQPYQIIEPYQKITPIVVDMSMVTTNVREKLTQQIISQDARRPFTLTKGPLLRVTLIRYGREDHRLLLTMHHIVADDWAINIFLLEVAVFYSAYIQQEEAVLPDLAIQYADFAHWQHAFLQKKSMESHYAYWQQQLWDMPAVMHIPIEKVRPTRQTFQGDREKFYISEQVTRKLRLLAQQSQTTLFTNLLAAFHVLLYRYTGQSDIIVGMPVANRSRTEMEELIGFFVNTLVLRTHPTDQSTFTDFLHHVHDVSMAAYEHQDVPFERLVELLQPQRALSHNPLFQVMFLYQNAIHAENVLALPGLEIERNDIYNGTIQCDLQLEIRETASELQGIFSYNVDLFETEAVIRMARHFLVLLNALAIDPDYSIARLPLLTPEEQQTFQLWNETQVPSYLQHTCLHQLIETQAEQTPDAIAVYFDGHALTYHALNQRANQIAHYLAGKGITPEMLIGVCMERSLEMIIGLLGILKAGGAYVPLDPTYPAERLHFMIVESKLSLIMTQKKWQPVHSDSTAKLCLDEDWLTIEAEDTTNLALIIYPDNLLYIIYTSGSTGKPKGVANMHSSLCNRLLWMRDMYEIIPNDRILQKAPLSFDVSVWECFLPLVSGACLIIAQPDAQRDAQALFDLITHNAITCIHFVPSLLRIFLDTPDIELCRTLRHVICSGEELPINLQQRFFQSLSAKLHNLYGPTEAAIDVTSWECDEASQHEYVPIGYPIANTQIYILDHYYQQVPIGVPGELHIAGANLARGYWQRADLTAERFIPNPFAAGTHPGSRLYCTGDLACYTIDGSIKFLGRIDNQVKLRGFRIEPGEIEAELRKYDLIQDCLVCVKGNSSDLQMLVAYVTMVDQPHNWVEILRNTLNKRLPEYMIPTHFIRLDTFPLTHSGKIDRLALPDPLTMQTQKKREENPSLTELEQHIVTLWQDVLHIDHIGLHDNFFDLGGHSLLIIRVQRELEKRFNIRVTVLDLFSHPTISSLVAYIAPPMHPSLEHNLAEKQEQPIISQDDIAVVGMAGRFPGAKNIDEFWQNLRNGVESISFFRDEELLEAGIDLATVQSARYVKASAIIEDVELFDALFFGYNPREAEMIDPQQRLFLECAWEALEHAGYSTDTYQGSIGVYAGLSMSSYFYTHLVTLFQTAQDADKYQILLGNDKDYLTTRTSYKLNLHGPSITVQTACSTSLVAVHLASLSLLRGECTMALAGGVSIRFPQKAGYWYQEGGISSPDGHCRAFDVQAQGCVGGDGVGIVVLKRLAEALRDGDTIYAIIKGSAINNDGATKVGYTAPGIQGQYQVLAAALKQARVEAETIRYIETHGTGTVLGDPIEVAALQQAYATTSNEKAYCALGAVKTNIGHLDAAAGIAGLIKTIMVLKHREIPPTLHFETPNPHIDLASTPFYINTHLTPWLTTSETPRRAAVSAFGIGGTNAHIILEEAPEREKIQLQEESQNSSWLILPLSAKTSSALDTMTTNLAQYLQQHPNVVLADVAYTLQVGRNTFDHRRVILCQRHEDAIQSLLTLDPTRVFTTHTSQGALSTVFMFPGQGTQHISMMAELYQHQALFKACIDQCANILQQRLGVDLRKLLYPLPEQSEHAARMLDQTRLTQPALFAVEYALAQLWLSWGIIPQAMIGHSVGEYVAACIAQVFSIEDALMLIADRAELMQQMSEGAMVAVGLSQDDLQEFLRPPLSLAAVNAPQQCVVAGPIPAIETLILHLQQRGITHHRLKASHAFHSQMMEQILEPFLVCVQNVELYAPTIPYISNITGTWITAEQATDPAYWVRHIRACVQFSQGVNTLLQDPTRIFLEVGPRQTLNALVRRHEIQAETMVISSLPTTQHTGHQQQTLFTTLGRLWLRNAPIAWSKLQGQRLPGRIPLPTYPFERLRYWVEPPVAAPGKQALHHQQASAWEKAAITDWFYIPTWKRTPLPNNRSVCLLPANWLIFSNQTSTARGIVQRLRNDKHTVIEIQAGACFEKRSEEMYTLEPGNRMEYIALLKELQSYGVWPQHIVYCWSMTATLSSQQAEPDRAKESAFIGLVYVTQAIVQRQQTTPLHIHVITNDTQCVIGDEKLVPEEATIGGLCKVIPQEYPFLTCTQIDFQRTKQEDWQEQRQHEQLIHELLMVSSHTTIAYRGLQRWVQGYEAMPLDHPEAKATWIRQGGIYLIIGGLGKIGLHIAKHLAIHHQATVILVGRTPFPEKTHWAQWVATHDSQDSIRHKIQALQYIETSGATVLTICADATDEEQMREVFTSIEQRFGAVHGVIYAAGVAQEHNFVPLSEIDYDVYESHMRPKMYGIMTLERVLQGKVVDFCLVCSSLSAILGGLGFATYAAANAFLDTFTHQQSLRGAVRWISVNWDGWYFENEDRDLSMNANIAYLALTPEEGLDAFARICSTDFISQIIVSTTDLQRRIEQWIEPSYKENKEHQQQEHQKQHNRPDLQNAYVAPRDEIERCITQIWQELLGIEPIGIYDNFLDLGGHSLLATQILAHLQEALQVELSLRTLLEYPTVAELAASITLQLLAEIGDEVSEDILTEISALTDDAREVE